MRILLDTDVLLDVLLGRGQVRHFLLDVMNDGNQLGYCTGCLAEIGKIARPQELRSAFRLIGNLHYFGVPLASLQRADKLRAAVEAKLILPVHAVIAATALEHKLTLATGNPKEYPVRGLKFLRLPKQ